MLKQLESNLRALRERIAQAAAVAERSATEIDLVCVTKTVPWPWTAALAQLGELQLGENRVQHLVPKVESARDANLPVRWHFIGHLQRNKARRAVQHADVFHSVDSIALLDTLDRVAGEEARCPDLYLEVKLVDRSQRTGFAPADVSAAAAHARRLSNVSLVGLMTMGPIPAPGVDPKVAFDRLAELRDSLDPSLFAGGAARLSMGMTSDLEAAIAAGSDVVRVGSALFEGLSDQDHSGATGKVAV